MNVDPGQIGAGRVDVSVREVPLTDEDLRERRNGSDRISSPPCSS